MKRIETLLALIIAFSFYFSFSLMAEDAVGKIMKEKKLTIPTVIQKILEERKLVAIYAQEFNDAIASGNKSKGGYLVVYYADKELAEKFWENGDMVTIDTENIEAKICFDVKKKIIRFCWYDEWGGVQSLVYAPL